MSDEIEDCDESEELGDIGKVVVVLLEWPEYFVLPVSQEREAIWIGHCGGEYFRHKNLERASELFLPAGDYVLFIVEEGKSCSMN